MRRIFKIFLALALAGAMAFALSVSGGAVSSTDCGLTLTKSQSYTNDSGAYVMSFTIKTGKYPGSSASYNQTKVKFNLYNSAGKSVANWDEKAYNPNTTVTREPSYNYNKNLSSGTYTMKVTVTVIGEKWNGYSYVRDDLVFVWSYNITHTQAAIVSLSKVEVIRNDDGSYENKLGFGHSGAKGQVLNVEIYNERGTKVYSRRGNPISYTSGTYSFYWNGYPASGGMQCESGTYTIKYWLDGKNAKQSRQYLSIY